MTDYVRLARELKPYILPWVTGAGGGAAAGGASGAATAHDLAGPMHSGTLAQSQAPWAATAASLNAHMANPDAHHARQHALDSTSDHVGTLAWVKVDKAGASLADLPTRFYTDLQSRSHSITGADHSIGGSAWDVVGNNAGALGLLTPSSDVSAGTSALLRSNAGALGLAQVTSATTLTLAPTSAQVLPTGSIQKDLGDYNRKWRTLHAAELHVETLVAQDVLATIGGRVMVAPTTTLLANVGSGATSIDVKHNNLHSAGPVGAYIYMASAPGGVAQMEVMKVANANPTGISGGYRYIVTRNVDGSGANAWMAGDAVANIGSATGHGWIDLTATQTIRNHYGPVMTIYSRSGMGAWSDAKPVVSVGNLRSFVDYGADQFGFALGNDLALTPATGFSGMTGDRGSGLRFFNADAAWFNGGAEYLRVTSADGIVFSPGLVGDWGSFVGLTFLRPSAEHALRVTGYTTSTASESYVIANGGITTYNASGISGRIDVSARARQAIASASLKAEFLSASQEGKTARVSATAWGTGVNGSSITLVADLITDETGNFRYAPGTGSLEVPSIDVNSLYVGLLSAAGAVALNNSLSVAGSVTLSSSLNVASYLNVNGVVVQPAAAPYQGVSLAASASSGWARKLGFHSGASDLGGFWGYGAAGALDFWAVGRTATERTLLLFADNHTSYPGAVNVTGRLSAPQVNATAQFERDGVRGGIYTPLTPVEATDTGGALWSGGLTKAVGSYTFDVNAAANGSVPVEAVAVVVQLSGSWATAAQGNQLFVKQNGAVDSDASLFARAQVNSRNSDAQGVVAVDANGQFVVGVAGATVNNALVKLIGYYI